MTLPVLYSKIAIYKGQLGQVCEGVRRLPIFQNITLNIVDFGDKSQCCAQMCCMWKLCAKNAVLWSDLEQFVIFLCQIALERLKLWDNKALHYKNTVAQYF